jgi:bifunctional ADP-heptose synthase (sugar kinase/adenylyltransferase)
MKTAEILDKITELRALVVGDLWLDRWCRYDPALAEPDETGRPRVVVTWSESSAGGAAAAASHLVALGAKQVGVIGALGDDGNGIDLERALRRRNIWPDLLIRSATSPTRVRTHFLNAMSGIEELPRIDLVDVEEVSASLEADLLDRLAKAWDDYDLMLVCDQPEAGTAGILSPAVRERLTELSLGAPAKVVWVESRRRPETFRGTIVSCRAEDADAACERLFGEVDYEQLRWKMRTGLFVVTKADLGALLVRPMAVRWVRSPDLEPPSVVADSFSAAGAIALAAGSSMEEAAAFANIVASVTARKETGGTASPGEVLQAELAFSR